MLDDAANIGPEAAALIAYEACVFFYPRVLLDEARRQHPAPANQFHHDWGLSRRCVSHPNPQVLYSTAWLDLKSGPVVLSLPNLRAHQLLISMIDARGRVFASAGARETGAPACEIAIVGPDWAGGLGQGQRALCAPTEHVWLVARTSVDPQGPESALTLQPKLRLAPIRRQGAPPTPATPAAAVAGWPARACAEMDAAGFFRRLAGLLDTRPGSRADAVVMESLRRIGVVPGRPFDLGRLSPEVAQAVCDGAVRAQAAIARPFGDGAEPWTAWARERGRGDDPLADARLAHSCIGLNLKEDAIYFLSERDSEGRPLNGAHRYRLHFDQFRTPQVETAWSLTAYDLNGALPAASGGRLGLSSRDRLRFNADGSIDLRIQRDPPLDPLAANWTPCPPGDFRLALRAYGPRHTVLSGLWRPPGVRRLHELGFRPGAEVDLSEIGAGVIPSHFA